MKSIRGKLTVLAATIFVLLTLVVLSWTLYSHSEAAVQQAYQKRYDSSLLASELRQSSDDLTRLGRTYVVTGDPSYEQQYNDILDIRNGKKPRPADDNRIYWDFVAATGVKPRPDTIAISLQALMKRADFSVEEFEKLRQAQANSDGLVQLEVEAMNAVKGLFKGPDGNYSIRKPPDMELARTLLHSKQYHQFKAEIMRPAEIASNIEQATTGTLQVSSNIEGVTQSAGETGKAAGDVVTSVQLVTRESADLRDIVRDFLREVKAV